jgi:hypothetical protein
LQISDVKASARASGAGLSENTGCYR